MTNLAALEKGGPSQLALADAEGLSHLSRTSLPAGGVASYPLEEGLLLPFPICPRATRASS